MVVHSDDMAKVQLMMHNSSNGELWYKRCGRYYPYYNLCENVAYNSRNEAQIMISWINSPEHEANIRSTSITHLGSGETNGYWTQDFGRVQTGYSLFPIDCSKENGFAWPQPAAGAYTIHTSDGLCLDGVPGNGGAVYGNTCGSTTTPEKTQLWQLNLGPGMGFTLTMKGYGLCMVVLGGKTSSGAKIGVESCTGSVAQQFVMNASNNILSIVSGICVELAGGGTHAPKATVDQWSDMQWRD
ncbi:hypothetical protein HK101_010828 [Irineochytrium annulatum]|nr:hypothetical protein HK101_010828 [Irineochytrium annulatum]